MICNNNYLTDIPRVCKIKDLIWVMRFQSPFVFFVYCPAIVPANRTFMAFRSLPVSFWKFLALSLSDVVFTMPINVKMPTIAGIFYIYDQDKFHAQLS